MVDVATIEKIEEKARLQSSSYKKDSNHRHLEKQNPTLKQLNDKRVLDRIRSEWRNSDLADEEAAGTCSMPTTGLPVQRETLFSDKMGCLKYERQLCKQT